jgi:hypothetical protein
VQPLTDLPHLVKLLDDDEPAVQAKLAEQFSRCSGDLSRELKHLDLQLSPVERANLSELLGPGRRRTLRSEWFVPDGGLSSTESGWATFEMLIRLLSDLLHDGITPRPNVVDALDELADEVTVCDAGTDEESLCAYLFESGRFRSNSQGYYNPENTDLLWILRNRKGNPIGLTVLVMLVARRLGLVIQGCSFPGHFLGWIGTGKDSVLVDCYHRGRLVSMKEMHSKPAQLSEEARLALQQPCSLHDILQRMLVNLQFALGQNNRSKDATLVSDLVQSMVTA